MYLSKQFIDFLNIFCRIIKMEVDFGDSPDLMADPGREFFPNFRCFFIDEFKYITGISVIRQYAQIDMCLHQIRGNSDSGHRQHGIMLVIYLKYLADIRFEKRSYPLGSDTHQLVSCLSLRFVSVTS